MFLGETHRIKNQPHSPFAWPIYLAGWEHGLRQTAVSRSAWARNALRYHVIALPILLFLLTLRRSHERVGRLAERTKMRKNNNEIQRRMQEAVARRPGEHHELTERLWDGSF
jgi:adenylate kinase